MFRLIHKMRVRIMTAPSFTGGKVLAAILFEGTMDDAAFDAALADAIDAIYKASVVKA